MSRCTDGKMRLKMWSCQDPQTARTPHGGGTAQVWWPSAPSLAGLQPLGLLTSLKLSRPTQALHVTGVSSWCRSQTTTSTPIPLCPYHWKRADLSTTERPSYHVPHSVSFKTHTSNLTAFSQEGDLLGTAHASKAYLLHSIFFSFFSGWCWHMCTQINQPFHLNHLPWQEQLADVPNQGWLVWLTAWKT